MWLIRINTTPGDLEIHHLCLWRHSTIDWNISHVTNHCGPYETTSSQLWLDDGTTRAHTIPNPSLVTILSCYLKSISCFKRNSVFMIYLDFLSSENTTNIEPLSFLCRKRTSPNLIPWLQMVIHPLHCGTQSLHNVLCCIMQIFIQCVTLDHKTMTLRFIHHQKSE